MCLLLPLLLEQGRARQCSVLSWRSQSSISTRELCCRQPAWRNNWHSLEAKLELWGQQQGATKYIEDVE